LKEISHKPDVVLNTFLISESASLSKLLETVLSLKVLSLVLMLEIADAVAYHKISDFRGSHRRGLIRTFSRQNDVHIAHNLRIC
jgi:hypothetical protein